MISSLFQAMDRLPSLAQEISMIGCKEVPRGLENSYEDAQALTMTMKNKHADMPPLEIEDYPQPLAVVGVSVLYVPPSPLPIFYYH